MANTAGLDAVIEADGVLIFGVLSPCQEESWSCSGHRPWIDILLFTLQEEKHWLKWYQLDSVIMQYSYHYLSTHGHTIWSLLFFLLVWSLLYIMWRPKNLPLIWTDLLSQLSSMEALLYIKAVSAALPHGQQLSWYRLHFHKANCSYCITFVCFIHLHLRIHLCS